MSDESLRELERRVSQDGHGAVVALARARCRAEGHIHDDGRIYMRFNEDAWLIHGDLSGAKSFKLCSRCGAEEPYEGTLSGRISAGQQLTTDALAAAGVTLDVPSLGAFADPRMRPVPPLEQAHPERRRGRRARRR